MLKHENLPDLTNMQAMNVLLIAVDNLDYETFIKKLDENNKDNPLAVDVDERDVIPEERFDQIKNDLGASIAMTGFQEMFGVLGDLFKSFADKVSNDIVESISGFGTVESPKPPDEKKDDAKRVKLTGEPAIDSEIIFNIIKQHTK